jgi:eukaryotic-like serine/threonine-protein kinase
MTEPRRLGDRYELGEVLGYGGMAEVLRGRDVRLGRDVAVKTLRVDLARESSFQARFRREAQSAASLNHPAIVAVYDTGESMLDGVPVPYIVMEYVDGRTLRDLLRAERHIMPTRALEITAEILKALDYSHRNGIIHRDIKPANVMLTRTGEVKVMDFGIARSVSQASAAVTQTAAVIGTAQYLSPEQARGEQVDPRSDVYSTGCLLYELLTGTPPFTGDSAVAVAYQHVREDPIPPSRVNADVSPAIDAIVLKAMAKNPANRYQSAAEMREDIERALNGVPVRATPLLHDQTVSMAAVSDERPARRQPRGRRSLVYTMLTLIAIALFIFLGIWLRNVVSTKHPAKVAPRCRSTPTSRSLSRAGRKPWPFRT